jgi:hypothetical protein
MRIESVPDSVDPSAEPYEETEEYDREMSPELLHSRQMSYEDRQLSTVDYRDDLRELVSIWLSGKQLVTKSLSLAFIPPQGCRVSICRETHRCTCSVARSHNKYECGRC